MRKVISILLVLVIILFSTPIFASNIATYEDYADSLAKLGVFVGTGEDYELYRPPTRAEGLVMLIRLLGAEDEANKMKDASLPFNDVPKWAIGYVAYAYENELTYGISDTKFGSSNTLDAKAYLTFLLRSLGYNDAAGDFSYNNALVFSRGIGLINDEMYSTLSSSTFLRAHIAKTSYDALKFPIRGRDILLIDKLMAEGKIDLKTGNFFKATVLPEPSMSINHTATSIDIAKNADSIVMLYCDTINGTSIGSGVVISINGEIITNYHVIEGAINIKITFNDGSQYTGDVYIQDYDQELDLAVIKINKTGLKPVKIGDSNKVRQGEPVYAIGSPYGLFNTITDGIVSAIRTDGIQISAAVNPGNSGGGLFNQNGELIGIINAGIPEAENLGFAIPVNNLSKVSDRNMITLNKFSGSFHAISPPTDIYILQEEDPNEVIIGWSPVKQADYYYFYYQEDGEDNFWYDEEAGMQIRFYDNRCTFYNLEPGIRYNVIVTSVYNGIESADSEIFSFVKGYGYRSSASNIYYDAHYGIPDFGKIAGCEPVLGDYINSYFYPIWCYEAGDIITYSDSLRNNGFYYVGSFLNSQDYTVMVYENYYLGKVVMTGMVDFDGIPGYFIVIDYI